MKNVHAVSLERPIKQLLLGCLAVELLLVLLDQIFAVHRLMPAFEITGRSFNMENELSAATWFSALQASLVALTAFAVRYAERRRAAPGWTVRGWLVVGLCFAYVGFDDAATVHENLGDAFGALAGGSGRLFGIEILQWHLFLGPVFAVAGLFIAWFLWKRFAGHRLRRYALIGVLCFLVAAIMDVLQAQDAFLWNVAEALRLQEGAVVHHWIVVEETLEMFGTTMFWQCFLRHLADLLEGDSLAFSMEQRRG